MIIITCVCVSLAFPTSPEMVERHKTKITNWNHSTTAFSNVIVLTKCSFYKVPIRINLFQYLHSNRRLTYWNRLASVQRNEAHGAHNFLQSEIMKLIAYHLLKYIFIFLLFFWDAPQRVPFLIHLICFFPFSAHIRRPRLHGNWAVHLSPLDLTLAKGNMRPSCHMRWGQGGDGWRGQSLQC